MEPMQSVWSMESTMQAVMEWQERKRTTASTGLLQDMLAFVSAEETPTLSANIDISPLYIPDTSMAPSYYEGSTSLLPYQDDETLKSIYEELLSLKPNESEANMQSPYENHLINPDLDASLSIEELSNVSANQAANQLNTADAKAGMSAHPAGRPPRRKGTPSYREAHIYSERQRRQDMTGLFNTLRSLLPNMQDDDQFKADRCTVLGHVIEYVQELDKKVEELGRVKTDLLKMAGPHKRKLVLTETNQSTLQIRKCQRTSLAELPTNEILHSSDVSVRFWGDVDIFITLNCPKQRGIWPQLLALLQDTLQLDVQNVTLSATPFFCVHSIYAKVSEQENHELSCEKLGQVLGQFVAAYKTAA